MKILRNPWKDDLMTLTAGARESVYIMSPYVKAGICSELLAAKPKETSLQLVSYVNLASVASGALDLSGLGEIIENGGLVKSRPKLHAKLYLFDEKRMVVTSGNLTNGGLIHNYEFGIYTADYTTVKTAVADFRALCYDELTTTVNSAMIADMDKMAAAIHRTIKPRWTEAEDTFRTELPKGASDIIQKELQGWQKEVFSCLMELEKTHFSLTDLNIFLPRLEKIYPNAKTPEATLRRVLQELRDMGLIEFLGHGNYRKLWQ